VRRKSLSVEKVLVELGKWVLAKQGEDLAVIDVKGLCSYADYLIIASARSTRQAKAIAEYLIEESPKIGVKPLGSEGLNYGNWVLLDFADIVVHIFYKPVREYYELEGLWADAKGFEINDEKDLKQFIPSKRRASRKKSQ